MPALVPIRFGSSPEGTPLRPLIPGVVGGGSCVIGPIAGTTPFDGLSATGIYSVSRKLRSAYVGDLYVADGLKRVGVLNDQSGSGLNLLDVSADFATVPSVVCFDANPANALQYTSGQILRSIGFTFNDFVTATNGYIIATVKVIGLPVPVLTDTTIIASNWTLNPGGLFLVTSGLKIAAFNNSIESVSAPILLDTVYVFEWRHEGGQVYLRINGTGEINTGAGNMNGLTLSNPLNFGGQFLSHGLTGFIWEAGFFSVVPNLATRDALVQDMGLWAGAAV